MTNSTELLKKALEKLRFYSEDIGNLYPSLEDEIEIYLESEKYSNELSTNLVPCRTDQQATHGFDIDSSRSCGRYVCLCEGLVPDDGC